METPTERENEIYRLEQQWGHLLNKERRLEIERRKMEIKGLCPKKDNCDACWDAKMSSPEWRANTEKAWEILKQIQKVITKLDLLY